ncbi:MAG: RadC family protein [Halanaerobiaceae bacterium]
MGADCRYTIKELPENERPREKLFKNGSENLSNAELIALIIRTGNRERTAVELAQDILNHFGGLKALVDLSVEEIQEIKGVGKAKAAEIQAVVELYKRLSVSGGKGRMVVNGPQDAANLVQPELRYLKQEVFRLILLDVKNQVISVPQISKGGLNSSIVHPREVFRRAIKRSSAAIILAHNHPSGIPEPSSEDVQVTGKLIEAGQIIGIEVLDHIVIGDGNYISMKQEGYI